MFSKALFNFFLELIGYLSVVQMTRLSANSANDTPRYFVRSFIYTNNSVQLSADPCGRPSSRVRLDDVSLSHLVAMVLLVRKPLIHLSLNTCIKQLERPFRQSLSVARLLKVYTNLSIGFSFMRSIDYTLHKGKQWVPSAAIMIYLFLY